ncbi:MAG: CoA pyrophosphatase [Dehalococcoidia bacterium]|nr:CoA pyrophosphatase [Dehalococcoidia bacterium]
MTGSHLTISRLEAVLKSQSGVDHPRAGKGAPAAVAVLFNITNDEPCVVMIKRANTLKHHSGQWAFPGGLIESSDESPMHAALRETNEELGVDARDIDIWCGMAPVDTSTGFDVWPFAGRIGDQVAITPFEQEVADVVNVPVRVFTDVTTQRTMRLTRNGSTRNMTAYAYEDRIIWGASARIIENTIQIVTGAA